jgi:hypothetical protein
MIPNSREPVGYLGERAVLYADAVNCSIER